MQPKQPLAQSKQQGVALLTVLLVVAMATVLAVAMVKAQQALLQRSSSVFSQDQAYLYTLGAESIAKSVLQDDKEKDQNKTTPQDSLNESWAKKTPPFPVDGGMVQAHIDDLQGRFNLNDLWQEDGQVNIVALSMFQRILSALEISPALASPIIDWIDSDNLPNDSDGAEEDWYLRLKPAYRSANRPFVSVSELSLLRGFTPEIVAKLSPYVSALPVFTTININTASAVVLTAMSDNMTLVMAKDLVEKRPAGGYGSVDSFLEQPLFANLEPNSKQNMMKMLGVRSQFFSVSAEAEVDGRHRVLTSVIARDDSTILRTISRDWSQQWQVSVTNNSTLTKANF